MLSFDELNLSVGFIIRFFLVFVDSKIHDYGGNEGLILLMVVLDQLNFVVKVVQSSRKIEN